jgi:hypothetical protein
MKSVIFIWDPPPTAVAVAMEERRKTRIKRQDSLPFFLVPSLMKFGWFRLLYKAADVVFDIPVGPKCWPSSMFDPLKVGMTFPFIRVPPWQLLGTPKMFHLGRQLCALWKGSKMYSRHILRKCLLEYQRLHSMPADVVRQVLYT